MSNIIFIGPNTKTGKGGIVSVIKEYKKIFPNAYYIGTTNAKSKISNLFVLVKGMISFIILLLIRPKIRIIHIHGASYYSFFRKFIFFLIGKIFGKKIVYHIHGGAFHLFYQRSGKLSKKIIEKFINNVDCLVCLSHKWKEFFLINFNPKYIEIIPNIVARVDPPNLKDEKPKNEKIIFLFLGNISAQKGVWLLLESIRGNLNDINGKAIFRFGGNGDIQKFNSLVKKYQLENIAEYIGWIKGEVKDKFFRTADIFILPSYIEGLPVSILEAFAYNLPIIATRVGGIPELINNKKNGILIKPGNLFELSKALLYAINNYDTLYKSGSKNSEIIEDYYPEAVVGKLNKIYNKIIS